MTETDFDPMPLIVTDPAPNPYEGTDGKQDDEGEQQEGLGGDTLPESPLTTNEALSRLHDLAAAHATVDWNGLEIKAYCLRVQRSASDIAPQHTDAQQDCDDNPDQHAVTYDTVDWTKVPRGAFVYFSGFAHGHIARFAGIHQGKPLIVSTDVIPGSVGYVDPGWFGQHWGMPLEAWSRVCNNTWQKGIPGNDQQGSGGSGGDGGQTQDGVKWKKANDGAHALWVVRGYLTAAVGVVDAIQQQWPDIEETKASVHDALAKVNHARSTLHDIAHPPEGKK